MSKIEKALRKAASQRQNEHSETLNEERAGQASSSIVRSPIYTKTLVQPSISIDLLERERLLGGSAENELRDCINLLRTQLLQKTRNMGWTTIMVTSPNPKAGKTTIATNLAISLARELNHTALLVDVCLNNSAVASRLGIDNTSGLSDYLVNQTPIENLLVNPGIEKLVVLPAGPEVGNSAELLGSSAMKKLVNELKHRYADRYIIFDAPHIIGVSDALIFSEYVDAILLVVGDSETKNTELQDTLSMLNNRNVLGIALNKVR